MPEDRHATLKLGAYALFAVPSTAVAATHLGSGAADLDTLLIGAVAAALWITIAFTAFGMLKRALPKPNRMRGPSTLWRQGFPPEPTSVPTWRAAPVRLATPPGIPGRAEPTTNVGSVRLGA